MFVGDSGGPGQVEAEPADHFRVLSGSRIGGD